MEYRIKEEVYDNGTSVFFPQFFGKVFEQKRSLLEPQFCWFEPVDGFVTINNASCNSFEEAMKIIKSHKPKKIVEEKIHEIN